MRPYIYISLKIAVVLCIVLLPQIVVAQNQPGAPLSVDDQKVDSTQFKETNNDEWSNRNVKVRYKYYGSDIEHAPDTSIHTFHRRIYLETWKRDLGNMGSAVQNLQFTPEDRLGPTLGYNAYNTYNYQLDSLKYYNATAPFSEFIFNLGSKLEQRVSVLHTQNIKPNWNVAAQYNRLSSEGYFLLQRTAQDHAFFSTNYQSINKRYKLNAGIVYNKTIQDENGGITDEEQLTNPDFSDRNTLDIAYAGAAANSGSAVERSLITNAVRNYAGQIRQEYFWGRTDTLYNEDSSQMQLSYTPRFSISHKLKLYNKLYTYKDKAPDSLRYIAFFHEGFGEGSDSVFTRQKHNIIDNHFALNGFLGKRDKQLAFSAGLGIRYDQFWTQHLNGTDENFTVGNYVTAQLQKEALQEGSWFYGADALFYITGFASGSSQIKVKLGKEFKKIKGSLEAGAIQNINNAPYNYTLYINQYDTISNNFNKESITQLYLKFHSRKYSFSGGVRNYLVSNYLYMNSQQLADQYAPSFNQLQVWLQKKLRWKAIVLDNEVIYQTVSSGAPVNIPMLMGRHQLSIESYIFKKALKIAFGGEVRYHTPYEPAAYSAFFNRYYYQNTYTLSNDISGAVFFNFNVKRLRAYIMCDQFQQLFIPANFINAPGYPAQNAMMRFGFNWVLLK